MNPATTAAQPPTALFHPASSPDYVPREPLWALQSERLREVVGRAYEGVPLYRQRMQKHGVTPADVATVEDVQRLPFTSKADLRDAYPLGMLAVPLHRVLRMYPIGGGPGQRMAAAFTKRDLAAWSELVVRCLASCGVSQGDVVQNACAYDLFTDGPGLHYAGECLGATVIPTAGGDAARQLAVMKDFGVSILCSTPSFLVYLLERAEKTGVDLRGLPLRAGVFVGEPWSEAMRRRIEESAGIKAYDVYGLPETIGPGVAVECRHQSGLHVFEDHFYPEIVDPASGAPRAQGEEGELVLTTLSKEAMPLVRYRTGDLTAILAGPCPCGRTLRRIRRIDRRADEMFVIQGVTVFPSQIEAALLAVEGTLPPYQLVLTQEQGLDQLEVQIEVTSRIVSDRVGAMEGLQSRLAEEIEKGLGISVPVRLVEPHAIERSQGKAGRVVDRRGPPPDGS